MPKQKRYKTKYPGVYYINGRGLEKGTKEKIYYIVFRKNGKLIEEKAGRQFQDKRINYSDGCSVVCSSIREKGIMKKNASRPVSFY